MSFLDFVVLIFVAGLAGTLGQALSGFSRGGCLVSVALGFIGALIGLWLARVMGLPEFLVLSVGGKPFPVVWSIAGAALFSAVLGLFSRPKRPADPRR